MLSTHLKAQEAGEACGHGAGRERGRDKGGVMGCSYILDTCRGPSARFGTL